MNYALTFTHDTARYSVHAATCTAGNSNRYKVRLPEVFKTVAAAVEYATADEYEKGGVAAKISICKCCTYYQTAFKETL